MRKLVPSLQGDEEWQQVGSNTPLPLEQFLFITYQVLLVANDTGQWTQLKGELLLQIHTCNELEWYSVYSTDYKTFTKDY